MLSMSTDTATFDDYYNSIVSDVGIEVEDAKPITITNTLRFNWTTTMNPFRGFS
jgi:flagellar hook-associated protein FlgK